MQNATSTRMSVIMRVLEVRKTQPEALTDSKHKAVFNLSGINASVGSSDTQLPRTKADYRGAGAGRGGDAGAGGAPSARAAAPLRHRNITTTCEELFIYSLYFPRR